MLRVVAGSARAGIRLSINAVLDHSRTNRVSRQIHWGFRWAEFLTMESMILKFSVAIARTLRGVEGWMAFPDSTEESRMMVSNFRMQASVILAAQFA